MRSLLQICGELCKRHPAESHRFPPGQCLDTSCSGCPFPSHGLPEEPLPSTLSTLRRAARVAGLSDDRAGRLWHRAGGARHDVVVRTLAQAYFSRVDFYASGTTISGDHMLRSESLFGKRETSSTNSPFSSAGNKSRQTNQQVR